MRSFLEILVISYSIFYLIGCDLADDNWDSRINQETFYKVFGGDKEDYGFSVDTTNDGGYVISTGSYIIKTDSEFNFDEWMNSENEINQLPNQFELSQNYPNPFNANTNIAYNVYEETFVQLIIYDILGNQIKELVNENQPLGDRIVSWKGDNNNGEFVTSGVYIYTLKAS